jgi:hypothetical protein
MAKKMNLFILKNTLQPTEANALEVITPLGVLSFDCTLAKKSIQDIPPIRTEMDNSHTLISYWLFEDCVVEFLRLNFNPKIPVGMKVDQCMCGIWRVKALKEVSCHFSCYLATNLEGSVETGESLNAQSFEDDHVILTIGTEDEECFKYRARSDRWFPSRLKSDIEPDQVKYLPHGISINLPNLLGGEVLQTHFNCAWSSKDNQEISTWFAVDEDPFEILKESNMS